MGVLNLHLSGMAEARLRFAAAIRSAEAGEGIEATPSIEFASYEDMHKVLTPVRLAIAKVLMGQGALPIREVARRLGRDVQAVHGDVTTLVNAGVIDRTADGIEFPYDGIHFDFVVSIEQDLRKAEALVAALIEGEESGEPRPFDFEEFEARKRAECHRKGE